MKVRLSFILAFGLYPLLLFAQDESLTITTYYPSPNGSYHELHSDQMTIGSSYRSGVTPPEDGLVVQGNVGIGTMNPQARLHVSGTAGIDGIMFPDGSLQTRATRIYSAIGSTNISKTGNEWSDMADMVVNLPADFPGGSAYIHFNAAIRKQDWILVRILLDGNQLIATPRMDLMHGIDYGTVGTQGGPPVSLSYVVSNLSAGAHIIKVQWKSFCSATCTINQDGTVSQRVLAVITGQ